MSATAPSIRIWIGLKRIGRVEDYDINECGFDQPAQFKPFESE